MITTGEERSTGRTHEAGAGGGAGLRRPRLEGAPRTVFGSSPTRSVPSTLWPVR